MEFFLEDYFYNYFVVSLFFVRGIFLFRIKVIDNFSIVLGVWLLVVLFSIRIFNKYTFEIFDDLLELG